MVWMNGSEMKPPCAYSGGKSDFHMFVFFSRLGSPDVGKQGIYVLEGLGESGVSILFVLFLDVDEDGVW